MRKFTNLAIAIGAGLCFGATAQADDLRFTTLPQTVQTTVIRQIQFPMIKCHPDRPGHQRNLYSYGRAQPANRWST